MPQLKKALEDMGAGDITIVCGGVIPQQDYEFLYDAGVVQRTSSRQTSPLQAAARAQARIYKAAGN